ncbi:MAG: hypothetical protein KJ623_02320 [Nanoarchaeota archaeon]|nr:hypothetical protein [Nanoarchaeota archaeon]MBU0962406.1 hypothetical protein [Nanoarchaeota archaeon]
MSEVNYVIDKLGVKFEGIFNIDEFYDTLKEFLVDLGYTVTEREFAEKTKENLTVKWKSTKAVDEYTQFVIKCTLKCNIQSIEIKNKKLSQGTLDFTVKAQIEKDFQDLWSGPIKAFMRGVYDKFIAGDKFEKLEEELKEDSYKIVEKAKHYLNMKRFKE